MTLSQQLTSLAGQYWSALIGALIVAAYVRQRFNEPTFPNRQTLPHTLVPFRYLFLRPSYGKARSMYVIASLVLYTLLLAPGRDVLSVLRLHPMDFPPQAWALLVALLLVGLLPTTSVPWVATIEESLRRLVHEWFLVPAGVEKTIGMLEDSPYQPPAGQLEALPGAQREKLESDLRPPKSSLRYRWARPATLVNSLSQMGAGAAHPLQKSAFEPFSEDLDAIQARFKAVGQDVAGVRHG